MDLECYMLAQMLNLVLAFVRRMKSLVDQGIHNVILTSGTLSPLAATISEISIPIKVQLSNQHIIKANQVRIQLRTFIQMKNLSDNYVDCRYALL